MAVSRRFFDWSGPLLPAAAEALVADESLRQPGAAASVVDLSAWLIVTPGARAGRRLVELLVDQCRDLGAVLTPPQLCSPGDLPERLYRPPGPLAASMQRQLAWIHALRSLDEAQLGLLMTEPPGRDDLVGWAGLADMIQRLHTELAGALLSFDDVPDRAGRPGSGRPALGGFDDHERWQVLAVVQRRYIERLAERGLTDPQVARRQAIEAERCALPADQRLLLLGVVDVEARPMFQAMLRQVADRLSVWLFAPQGLAHRYDALGFVEAEAWRDAPIELADNRIELADRPADQADAVVRSIAAMNGAYSAEQITVGVCEPTVAPHLQRQLALAGLPVRYAVGRSLSQSPPVTMLRLVAELLGRGWFSDMATLLRHTDVERAILKDLESSDRADRQLDQVVADLLTLSDRYYTQSLHGQLTGHWLGEARWRERIGAVYEAVRRWLGELTGPPRCLADWAEPIAALLRRTYGHGPLNTTTPHGRVVAGALEPLAELLGAMGRLAEMGTDESVPAAQAIRLLLTHLRQATIPPEPDEAAIEMLGWLELPLDDAPVLLVTGFNEQAVPQSVTADPFLPNHLRHHLGLLDNDRRYARDAHALVSLLASRQQVKLIAGQRGDDGQPLMISRLLLSGDVESVARRVNHLLDEDRSAQSTRQHVALARLGRVDSGVFDDPQAWPPPPTPPFQPISSLPVTAFATYLACRYRFYLRHVLGLERLDDAARELTPRSFGSIAHEVLAEMGRRFIAEPRLAGQSRSVQQLLDQLLDARFDEHYGTTPAASVCFQREQLRQRLHHLAVKQSQWHEAGWRIEHVELSINAAPLLVDGEPVTVHGQPFTLRGRIDRVDVNEAGERRVFDYKTGETVDSPNKTHFSGGRWIDLQLPLYRHLAAHHGLGLPEAVGYIVLPADLRRVDQQLAGWDFDELADADRQAREVVHRINSGQVNAFYPPGESLSRSDEFAAICGVDQFLLLDIDDAGDVQSRAMEAES